jgi:hypothetical protein
MIKVTAQSLKDFQVCGRYYDFKYNDEMEETKNIRKRRVERFSETIRSIATFFFYKKQAFSEPSYQALEHRWQKNWFKEDTSAIDIATARNEILWESDISYTTQAAAALMAFHEYFANKLDEEVVLIDESFTVPINKHVAIEGVFDLVTRKKNKTGSYEYIVYKWITSDLKKPSSYWTFDFAMLDYAFHYRNKSKEKVSYFIWDFGSTIPGAKQIEVEPEDIKAMIFWCESLEKEQSFPPRRGLTAYCKSCVYDKPCANWSFNDVKI